MIQQDVGSEGITVHLEDDNQLEIKRARVTKASFFQLSQRSHTELLYIYVGFSAMWKDKSLPSNFAGITSQEMSSIIAMETRTEF